MIKSLIVIILMVPGLLYLGCASQPASLPTSLPETRIIDHSGYYDQVREGTSTKQDVKALFGEPLHVFVRPIGETWSYRLNNNIVMFRFNDNGLVIFKSSAIGLGTSRTVIRNTDMSRCAICGQPTVHFDDERGPLCINHISKSGTMGVKNEKGKRSPSQPIEED